MCVSRSFAAPDTRVCVVGLGYVGLPMAAILASRGFSVHGVDINRKAVDTINAGKAHIVEPDLDIILRAAIQTGNLKAHLTPAEADVFVVCVPTPCTADHKPDMRYVFEATESICPFLRKGNLVILESTSPPGTTEEVGQIIRRATHFSVGGSSERPPDIFVAHAPERILPGKVLREVVENHRIVGGIDKASTAECAAFYRSFVTGDLLLTEARIAETAKLVENAYRDVNIAFANEVSLLAEELGIDVWELIELANKHPRVKILSPGAGVGGHCIAVDPWFLVWQAPGLTRMIRTAREVNDYKPRWIVERVLKRAARLRSPKIAVLGLAYKPDIDDLRESPAVAIAHDLIESKVGEVRVVEPNLREHPEFKLVALETAIADADIVVVLVAHKEFKGIHSSLLQDKTVIDACGALRNHDAQ
jgi:UDP-N-acetyl-D-mannosaminuronic acid dehydrogenase